MKKSDKVTTYFLIIMVSVFMFWLGGHCALEVEAFQDYSIQPKSTVYVEYSEKCQCGHDAKVEYSISVNNGFYYCDNCMSSFEFSLDKDGNRVVENKNGDK